MQTVRTICIFVILLLLSGKISAEEGMWLPSLIHKNIEEMQSMGLELSALDLYNEDGVSLKDGIVRFGRGCTGAFISESGLLITNHHCGYGQIQRHSSMEQDYLTEGFWAASQDEELPNAGLTITLLVRMENVSDRVLQELNEDMTEEQRAEAVRNISRTITEESEEDGLYEASVQAFYFGNEYYLFVFQVYKDVRLVGAPPSSIGKFGGDVDNWMWPRHTGDFALFRVYADEKNMPAEFSTDNQPYKPAHFFPLANKGVSKHDFTMVYGFPGRTTQYLRSQSVEFIMEKENPMSIDLRTQILQIYERNMQASDEVRIQYAGKQARVANAWKKWAGENRGLERLNAIEVKQKREKEFDAWIKEHPDKAEGFGNLSQAFEEAYETYLPYRFAQSLYREAIWSIELIRFAGQFNRLMELADEQEPDSEVIQAEVDRLIGIMSDHFRDYNADTDRKVMKKMLAAYLERSEEAFMAPDFASFIEPFDDDMGAYTDHVFSLSLLTSETLMEEFLHSFSSHDNHKLKEDPGIQMAQAFSGFFNKEIRSGSRYHQTTLDSLYRKYTEGLRLMKPHKNFFPDANGTLRISYGRVEGSFPRDAVKFMPYTTTDGILNKAAQVDIPDYRIPESLENLLNQKEYGNYTHNGSLMVNFISSNHTTGGNSGSPVINGKGELMGLNFDRSWESTMSDIMFDPEQCRNISVHSQYILWIIEHFAEMRYLIDEMDVRDKNH